MIIKSIKIITSNENLGPCLLAGFSNSGLIDITMTKVKLHVAITLCKVMLIDVFM